jgi:hypothetical protein
VKDTLITAMNAPNQNPKNDSLKITQNADGSYTMDWDKEDPNWSWMNSLTSKEIQVIIEEAIKDFTNGL